MKQHPSDLVALLFGLAFTITGGLVIVSQATDVQVDPHWGAAVGLIVLGVVALAATFARAHNGRPVPAVVEPLVTPEDPAD